MSGTYEFRSRTEAGIQCRFRLLVSVLVLLDLRSDEHILSFYLQFFQSCADCVFVLVEFCCVNVPEEEWGGFKFVGRDSNL